MGRARFKGDHGTSPVTNAVRLAWHESRRSQMDSSVLAERPVSSAFDSGDHRFARPARHVAGAQRGVARRAPIVAAIDGTRSGLAAAAAAARFARATVAPLVLVYVRTGPPG